MIQVIKDLLTLAWIIFAVFIFLHGIFTMNETVKPMIEVFIGYILIKEL